MRWQAITVSHNVCDTSNREMCTDGFERKRIVIAFRIIIPVEWYKYTLTLSFSLCLSAACRYIVHCILFTENVRRVWVVDFNQNHLTVSQTRTQTTRQPASQPAPGPMIIRRWQEIWIHRSASLRPHFRIGTFRNGTDSKCQTWGNWTICWAIFGLRSIRTCLGRAVIMCLPVALCPVPLTTCGCVRMQSAKWMGGTITLAHALFKGIQRNVFKFSVWSLWNTACALQIVRGTDFHVIRAFIIT